MRWDNRFRASTKVGQWFGSAYTDPIYGAYDSISTVTVGSGGTSAITFSSIPSTYSHLQIRGMIRGGGGEVRFTVNGDTTANYSFHVVAANNSTVAAGATANANYGRFFVYQGLSVTASTFGVFVMDILDYKNTNKYKTFRTFYGEDTNSAGEIGHASAAWFNTNAINSITIYNASGNLVEFSQCALYGIRA